MMENLRQIISIVREQDSVQKLFDIDTNTEIYSNQLNKNAIEQLNSEYPDFFSIDEQNIYSINVISSVMMEKGSYKKIRFYINPSGEIIKKFES